MNVVSQARHGDAAARYALGRHYLHGTGGMARNPAVGLEWLIRAAQQGLSAAARLICTEVPLDTVLADPRLPELAGWFRRYALAGDPVAEWAYLRLFERVPEVLSAEHEQARLFATLLLESIARNDNAEAQWRLARLQDDLGHSAEAQRWAGRAAQQGHPPAVRWLADRAWQAGQHAVFVDLAQPEVRRLLAEPCALQPDECTLLLQYFQACGWSDPVARDALLRAARQEHAGAAFALGRLYLEPRHLGLRHSPGQPDAPRVVELLGIAAAEPAGAPARPRPGFRNAVKWLEVAARQGHADAAFLLGLVFRSAAFSRRNTDRSDAWLEAAAAAGQTDSQFWLAQSHWRQRHVAARHALQAMQWMVRAAQGGHAAATAWLDAHEAREEARSDWPAGRVSDAFLAALLQRHPAMATRIALGQAFGLRRLEVLLTDWQQADHEHCLVLDLSAWTPKHATRFVPIRKPGQRQLLDLARYRFRDLDTGPDGPEGNYRQRLYRFEKILREAESGAARQRITSDRLYPVRQRATAPGAEPGQPGQRGEPSTRRTGRTPARQRTQAPQPSQHAEDRGTDPPSAQTAARPRTSA